MALSHVVRRLPILILHPHSRCNCRCRMCDIWRTTSTEELTVQRLERLLPDIERLKVEQVVFSGGEPLMHSDLFALARPLRALGVRLTLLTTGLLLERFAREVAEELDEAIVSLDGPQQTHDAVRRIPGAYRGLAEGVAAVRRRAPDFPIHGRCTVQKANHDRLADTVAAARELGLDSISFLAVDVTSEAFNRPGGWGVERQQELALTPDELGALEEQIEIIADDPLVRESPAKLEAIARRFAERLGRAEPQAPLCNAPWVSAVVETDGLLRPCFFHRPIGRVGEHGLEAALNSNEGVEFRRRLDIGSDPTCRRCVCSLRYRGGGATPAETTAV